MKPLSLTSAIRMWTAGAGALLGVSSNADAETIKVFLLGGQSNMVGRGLTSGLPESLQTPQADVQFFWGQGGGRDPLVTSGLMTLRPGSGGNANEFGPEIVFGRTIADASPTESFALIKYAAEGTNLHTHWDPKAFNSFYKTFRATVTAGVAALTDAGHTVEIAGMLWYQGGADAKLGRTTAQYEFDQNEFIADVRDRYGANLPFFIGRLPLGAPTLTETELMNIRTAQELVAAADPFTHLVDVDGISYGANDHFNAAGQIFLGSRFGETYIQSIPEPTMALTVVSAMMIVRDRRRTSCSGTPL